MSEQNPYAYGFARMPRIIRKGYKNLTKLQKLLYIYLRDLCGEDGTCYRSLRTLQKETDFSLGYLSENIPLLHNEGLIHAEMRKGTSTHWEVWHITIVDIWEANATFIQEEKAKCSPDEQIILETVHDVNRSVHQMNRLPESVHSVNESVHAVILNKKNTENQVIENKERDDSVSVASASTNESSPQNETTSQHVIPILEQEPLLIADSAPEAKREIIQDKEQKQKTTRKAAPPKAPLTPEEIAMNERCKTWQAKFNDWRGYELETKGAIINERRCIRRLCEKFPDEEIPKIYLYLFREDWRWSKPDNRFKIGANEVLSESGRVLAYLKQQNQQSQPRQRADIASESLINSPTINGTRNLAYEMDMMEKKFLESKNRKRA